jgi:L-iditol 2-dehydrogenase
VKAAKLYGARDFRIEDSPEPPPPGPDEAVIRVGSVGVCGSDLHTYEFGRIGDSILKAPFVLGHEFAGTVIALGPDATSGFHQPLEIGQRVAVEPAIACWQCDLCEEGHPNLCRNMRFMGLMPDDGALQECFAAPARNCFPIPDTLSMAEGALLEPLGVALHAVDLGKLKVAKSVAVLGCGPIGLLIIRLAALAGAAPIYAFDRFGWRLDAALRWGASEAINIDDTDAVKELDRRTQGRGVKTVFEAAWAGEAVDQAFKMADLGGRIVLVGVPAEDTSSFTHSVARRKGLTVMLCRRMKHTYPRTIPLAASGQVELEELITHRFGLDTTGEAFALNAAYRDHIIKAMIDVDPAAG